MQRPNITKEEAKMLIAAAPDSINNSINKLVTAGRISKAEAAAYLKKAIIPVTNAVMVLAIRGYYKNSMGKAAENDRGIYDDAFVVIGPNYFKTFNANTDPRKYADGIATLLPGLHFFKQGLHGFGRKTAPYKAFRTDNVREVLPVTRDGQKGIKEGITVNIHAGGEYQTNSAACQTVIKSQYNEFQKELYELMNKEGQKTLPFLLLEE